MLEQKQPDRQRTVAAESQWLTLTLLHSERPKLHRVLAFLRAIGLKVSIKQTYLRDSQQTFSKVGVFFPTFLTVVLLAATQRAFGAKMTSYQRQCDVITSHRR